MNITKYIFIVCAMLTYSMPVMSDELSDCKNALATRIKNILSYNSDTFAPIVAATNHTLFSSTLNRLISSDATIKNIAGTTCQNILDTEQTLIFTIKANNFTLRYSITTNVLKRYSNAETAEIIVNAMFCDSNGYIQSDNFSDEPHNLTFYDLNGSSKQVNTLKDIENGNILPIASVYADKTANPLFKNIRLAGRQNGGEGVKNAVKLSKNAAKFLYGWSDAVCYAEPCGFNMGQDQVHCYRTNDFSYTIHEPTATRVAGQSFVFKKYKYNNNDVIIFSFDDICSGANRDEFEDALNQLQREWQRCSGSEDTAFFNSNLAQ